jgi:RNA-directed DNA polymerase
MPWSLKQHPGKTFIGRIDKGFDFLGYRFSGKPLALADITVRNHVERRHRLYEQQQTQQASPTEAALALGDYVKRWRRWCTAGLSIIKLEHTCDEHPINPRAPLLSAK